MSSYNHKDFINDDAFSDGEESLPDASYSRSPLATPRHLSPESDAGSPLLSRSDFRSDRCDRMNTDHRRTIPLYTPSFAYDDLPYRRSPSCSYEDEDDEEYPDLSHLDMPWVGSKESGEGSSPEYISPRLLSSDSSGEESYSRSPSPEARSHSLRPRSEGAFHDDTPTDSESESDDSGSEYNPSDTETVDVPRSKGHGTSRTKSRSVGKEPCSRSRSSSHSSHERFRPYTVRPVVYRPSREGGPLWRCEQVSRSEMTQPTGFNCPHCGYIQLNRRRPDLRRHILTHYQRNLGPSWICCGVPVELADEYRVPSTVRPVAYSQMGKAHMVGGCGASFSRKDAYLRHLRGFKGCVGDPNGGWHRSSKGRKQEYTFGAALYSSKAVKLIPPTRFRNPLPVHGNVDAGFYGGISSSYRRCVSGLSSPGSLSGATTQLVVLHELDGSTKSCCSTPKWDEIVGTQAIRLHIGSTHQPTYVYSLCVSSLPWKHHLSRERASYGAVLRIYYYADMRCDSRFHRRIDSGFGRMLSLGSLMYIGALPFNATASCIASSLPLAAIARLHVSLFSRSRKILQEKHTVWKDLSEICRWLHVPRPFQRTAEIAAFAHAENTLDATNRKPPSTLVDPMGAGESWFGIGPRGRRDQLLFIKRPYSLCKRYMTLAASQTAETAARMNRKKAHKPTSCERERCALQLCRGEHSFSHFGDVLEAPGTLRPRSCSFHRAGGGYLEYDHPRQPGTDGCGEAAAALVLTFAGKTPTTQRAEKDVARFESSMLNVSVFRHEPLVSVFCMAYRVQAATKRIEGSLYSALIDHAYDSGGGVPRGRHDGPATRIVHLGFNNRHDYTPPQSLFSVIYTMADHEVNGIPLHLFPLNSAYQDGIHISDTPADAVQYSHIDLQPLSSYDRGLSSQTTAPYTPRNSSYHLSQRILCSDNSLESQLTSAPSMPSWLDVSGLTNTLPCAKFPNLPTSSWQVSPYSFPAVHEPSYCTWSDSHDPFVPPPSHISAVSHGTMHSHVIHCDIRQSQAVSTDITPLPADSAWRPPSPRALGAYHGAGPERWIDLSDAAPLVVQHPSQVAVRGGSIVPPLMADDYPRPPQASPMHIAGVPLPSETVQSLPTSPRTSGNQQGPYHETERGVRTRLRVTQRSSTSTRASSWEYSAQHPSDEFSLGPQSPPADILIGSKNPSHAYITLKLVQTPEDVELLKPVDGGAI
ncbi:hypothetical protein NM688_g6301 [Phlebia brevispora]|uniref:Uncharacterized protein n=1 Tax=Phlebia brevispora TaxID=194682 RepID=A0ACC1SHL4_9APHY|nr:hypothetical protein NM688_g6301 [Phlebia brevispora]